MPADRLSPEREQEIREWFADRPESRPESPIIDDLISELDALRVENRELTAQRDALAGALLPILESSCLCCVCIKHTEQARAALSQPTIAEALAADQELREALVPIMETIAGARRRDDQYSNQTLLIGELRRIALAAERKWGPK